MWVSLEAADVALRSVGTALTLASAGFYLHNRGFISPDATKAFGRYIQQVSIPAFFFTKLVQCPTSQQHAAKTASHDGEASSMNDQLCPSIFDHLSEAWILLIWPLYVIGCGIAVGLLVAWWSQAPKRHYRSIMLGTAFANSGSLPTTLLFVLHQHSMSRSGGDGSVVDPNAFLSLYLILHPMILWSVGFWLAEPPQRQSSSFATMSRIQSADLSDSGLQIATESFLAENNDDNDDLPGPSAHEETGLLRGHRLGGVNGASSHVLRDMRSSISKVMSKACQPPVIGSLLGLIVTLVTPLRKILIQPNGPLDWWFDGVVKIGSSSIPVSMAVLGMNLSSSLQKSRTPHQVDPLEPLFGWKTLVGIIVGKLVFLPIVGFLSFALLRSYSSLNLDSPSLSMVLLIVWITPTANNAVVVADLAGGLREAMAQLLAYEYVVVPALLSITVACIIRISGLDVSTGMD